MTSTERQAIIEALRREHILEHGYRPLLDCCRACGSKYGWPCPPAQAADELERLGEIEENWDRIQQSILERR